MGVTHRERLGPASCGDRSLQSADFHLNRRPLSLELAEGVRSLLALFCSLLPSLKQSCVLRGGPWATHQSELVAFPCFSPSQRSTGRPDTAGWTVHLLTELSAIPLRSLNPRRRSPPILFNLRLSFSLPRSFLLLPNLHDSL